MVIILVMKVITWRSKRITAVNDNNVWNEVVIDVIDELTSVEVHDVGRRNVSTVTPQQSTASRTDRFKCLCIRNNMTFIISRRDDRLSCIMEPMRRSGVYDVTQPFSNSKRFLCHQTSKQICTN